MGKHSDEIKMDVRMWKGLGILKRKPKAIIPGFHASMYIHCMKHTG